VPRAREGRREEKKVVQRTIRATVKFISASWIPKIARLPFLPHRADVGMLRRSNLIIFMQRVRAGGIQLFFLLISAGGFRGFFITLLFFAEKRRSRD